MADTTEKTIADELREAATRWRTAGNAASRPPWRRDGMAIVTRSGTAALAYNGVDADWIALAAPDLAEPLASWLETEALMWEERGNSSEGHTFHALAVARVLNGTSQEVSDRGAH